MLQTDLTASTPRLLPLSPTRIGNGFSIVDRDPYTRDGIEERIRQAYRQHFGACIKGFMAHFACYTHESGASGVLGMRCAAEEPLFLERYLAEPIEETIRSVTGLPVSRNAIAEVGQFAVDDPRTAADMFRELVPFLIEQGFDWVCFTGTIRVRAILSRLGFHGLPVALGDPLAGSDSGDDWGSYYDNAPVVIVGKLADPAGYWCGSCAERTLAGAQGA